MPNWGSNMIVLLEKFIWMFSRFHWDDFPKSLGCFSPFIQMKHNNCSVFIIWFTKA
jgi:hypothetical protein